MKEMQNTPSLGGESALNGSQVGELLRKAGAIIINGARTAREAAKLDQITVPVSMLLDTPRKRDTRSFVPLIGFTPSLVPSEVEDEVFERLAYTGDPGAVMPSIE